MSGVRVNGKLVSNEEYAELRERTIRIIQSLPCTYLSRDKADAAVEAIRAGTDPRVPGLYDEVWDAAMEYSKHLKRTQHGCHLKTD